MPNIKELVGQLNGSPEATYVADRTLLATVRQATAPGQDAQRAEVAAALVAELTARTEPRKDDRGRDIPSQPVHSARVRSKIASLLGYVLSDEQVPALVEALKDFDVRESARQALEANPSPATTKALLDALQGVGPRFRVGVVGALANRREPEVLAALREAAANDSDQEVRLAAIEAIACFPAVENDATIAQAVQELSGAARTRALRARVRLAEALRTAGRDADARKIYRAIQSGDTPDAQKKAADIGLKATA
jgi:HEAT repeat protein